MQYVSNYAVSRSSPPAFFAVLGDTLALYSVSLLLALVANLLILIPAEVWVPMSGSPGPGSQVPMGPGPNWPGSTIGPGPNIQ